MLTNEFLNNVCEKIKYKPIRSEIFEELKNHIEEQKDELIQNGTEEKIAEETVIQNMGNAEELGKNINVNIIKIITLSIISLFFVMRESTATSVIIALVYMIISTIKLREKAKKYIVVLWAIPIILIALIMIMNLSNGFAEYRINRILINFKPEIDPQSSGWQLIARNEMIKSAKLIGEAEGTELYTRLLFEEEGNWAFISILVNYGWIVSIGMLLAIILLSVKLITNSINIKEEYGKWITIGISAMFILESLFNVAMNLGFGVVAGFNLPLISYGRPSLIMNIISLALVLSVYRRKDINISRGEHCSSV